MNRRSCGIRHVLQALHEGADLVVLSLNKLLVLIRLHSALLLKHMQLRGDASVLLYFRSQVVSGLKRP